MSSPAPPLLLLGPQLRVPTLADGLGAAGLGAARSLLAISAGWQEREGELAALEAHLGRPVEDLRLYARTEALFAADPPLAAAYRNRQSELRELQELYRLRLEHAKAAVRAVRNRPLATTVQGRAQVQALGALRALDREHLANLARVHADFDVRWTPLERPALRTALEEVRDRVAAAEVVLVAGGHVAVLLNRLRLFGAAEWLRGRPLAAWSAGAMVLAREIVLFHDHTPQGAGNTEVFEAGLGVIDGLLPLPHARTRLDLADPRRVALLAQRFAPTACLTLDHGDWLRVAADGRCLAGHGRPRRLGEAGGLLDAGAAA